MPEALLWRDHDWRRQQRTNKYDEYVDRLYAPRSYRWKSPSACEPKWKYQSEFALEANSSLEERPRLEMLNEQIDKVYDEIANLVACRSDQSDPALEKQISALFQRLRELQKQAGDLIEQAGQAKLAGPIAAGLDILKRTDEIRAKYGSTSAADTSSQDSNIQKMHGRITFRLKETALSHRLAMQTPHIHMKPTT